jgi:FAD/FMN-containing dehydrogenase
MDASGCERALAAARCVSVRVAAHLDPALAAAVDPVTARDGPVLLLELAGDEALLEADRTRLIAELGAREVDPDVIDRLRGVQAGSFEPGGLRIRISALPSRMADVAARIQRDGGALFSYPARGLVYARFPVGLVGDERRVDAAVRSARLASQAGGGAFVIEEAPAWAKEGRDVFGEPGPLLPLFRALKRRYDPKGVLNPGRFAGCL